MLHELWKHGGFGINQQMILGAMFMKKFLSVMLLAFGIALSSHATAAEVYIGERGIFCVYLLTESINVTKSWPLEFTCTATQRQRGEEPSYLDTEIYFSFFTKDGLPYCITNFDFEPFLASPQNSPIAYNIYRYVLNNT